MDDVDLGREGPEEQQGRRPSTAADRATKQAKASILLAEGNAHAAAGRFDEAMASMASALAMDPTNLDILDALDECRALQAAADAPQPQPQMEAPEAAVEEPSPRTKGREQAARWQQEGYIGAGGETTGRSPAAKTDANTAASPRSEPPLFMREAAGKMSPESRPGATAATEPEPEPTLPTEGTGWAGALGKKLGMSDEMIVAMNAVRLHWTQVLSAIASRLRMVITSSWCLTTIL